MISISRTALWLATWKARAIVAASLLASVVAWRVWDKEHQRAIGAAEVITASKEEGAKANAKSAEDRRKSDTPDAAERLRKSACRDCK